MRVALDGGGYAYLTPDDTTDQPDVMAVHFGDVHVGSVAPNIDPDAFGRTTWSAWSVDGEIVERSRSETVIAGVVIVWPWTEFRDRDDAVIALVEQEVSE